MLADATFIVNYTEDMNGYIDRIWILTQDEMRLPAANTR